MKNLTPEMIEKAKAAKSAEELLEIAKANNIEMTADEAATYFAQLNPKSGELNDDDLDNVAGGACVTDVRWKTVRITSEHACPKCSGKIGTIKPLDTLGGAKICCNNCGAEIVRYIENCTYEFID